MLGYKTRRIPYKAYKKQLWNATNHLIHFRSVLTEVASLNTPASFTGSTLGCYYADEQAGGDSFTTVDGGLQVADTGLTPTFNGENLVRRGGQFFMTLMNNVESGTSNGDSMYYSVILLRCSNNWSKTDFEALSLTPHSTWDSISDFKQRFGTIILKRSGVLKEQDSASISYRLPIQKIDWYSYNTAKKGSSKYVWGIVIANGFGNTAQTCRFRYGYNVSFTGDVITTPA